MNHDVQKVIKSIRAFRLVHKKVLLPDRKSVIKEQYDLLIAEYDGYANITFKETAESIDIKISADSILACDDGGNILNSLIGSANVSNFYTVNNQVILELWFRCWKWVDKSSLS